MRRAWLLPLAAALLAAGAEARLTLEQLRSAEYRSELSVSGRVRLRDGAYRESGAGGRFSVTLSEPIAFGDLDGDGDEDAVVTLVSEAEGIGSFRDLAVVLDDAGRPHDVATRAIAEHTRVESMAIEQGVLLLSVRERDASGAPGAGPQRLRRYALKGSRLVALPD